MNLYEEFIHKSRYARYKDNINRREHWEETVQRFVDFIAEQRPNIGEENLNIIREAIIKKEVMPSMRALMTAGVA